MLSLPPRVRQGDETFRNLVAVVGAKQADELGLAFEIAMHAVGTTKVGVAGKNASNTSVSTWTVSVMPTARVITFENGERFASSTVIAPSELLPKVQWSSES